MKLLKKILFRVFLSASLFSLTCSLTFSSELAPHLQKVIKKVALNVQGKDTSEVELEDLNSSELNQALTDSGLDLEELLDASMKIVKSISANANGDIPTMISQLQKARRDPAQFYKSLSPQAQDAVSKLAEKMQLSSSAHKIKSIQ